MSSRAARTVPVPEYHDAMKWQVSELLRRNDVLVAYVSTVPGVAIGWACGKNAVLHYVFVKQGYRRSGVATVLWQALGCPKWGSCDTYSGAKFAAARGIVCSPIFLMR